MERSSLKAAYDEIEAKYLPMPRLNISCWKVGWLPFDYLMTDLYSGCLPVRWICYGNCSAASHWISEGYDFGKRSKNEFHEDSFKNALDRLPSNQRWLRQGWASDFSHSAEAWAELVKIAKILADRNMHLLVITKLFHLPKESGTLSELANCGTEIRVSISGTDSEAAIARKQEFLKKYRREGGIAIPYLMTAKFRDPDISNRQNRIIDWVIAEDFVWGEHPLRLNSDNSLVEAFDLDKSFRHAKFPDEIWFGRILENVPHFFLPAPTHLLPNYAFRWKNFHEAEREMPEIHAMLDGNLPTWNELSNGRAFDETNLRKHATYRMNPQTE